MNLTTKPLLNLKEKFTQYQEHLTSSPWEEASLDLLVWVAQEIENLIKTLTTERGLYYTERRFKKDYSRVEELFIYKISWESKSIDSLLWELASKLETTLDLTILEEILKELKIFYKKTKETILPTIDWIWIQSQEDSNQSYEKKDWFNKLKLLILLLRDNWIYTDYLTVVIWENKEEMMREESYIFIYIPRIKKTVLVSNEYWEATFIFNWRISESHIYTLNKEELTEKHNWTKIIFNKENQDLWIQELTSLLFTDQNQEQIQISKNKPDIPRMEKYRQEVLRIFPDPEDLMSLTHKQIWKIKILWKWLNYLANTIFLLDIKINDRLENRAKFLSHFYWKTISY